MLANYRPVLRHHSRRLNFTIYERKD
jgi:hypothetical protein